MRIFRVFLIAIMVVMAGLLLDALVRGDFSAAKDHLWAPPWGRLTLIDALAALSMLYVVIAALEPRWERRAAWLAGVALTGSAAIALFFFLHARRVQAQTLAELIRRPRPE